MATETPIQHLTINKLTKAQYDAATKSDTELYFITDAGLDALLKQSGNAGKFLTTNGSSVSWGDVEIPTKVSELENDTGLATVTIKEWEE